MGWNGSGDKNAAPEPKKAVKAPPSKWRGLIALLAIVVGGIAAWFALRPADQKEADKPAPAKLAKIAETKPKIVTNKAEKETAVAPKGPEPEMWNGHEIASKTVTTNGMRVMTRMVGKDGKIYVQRSNTDAAKPIFSNPVDQILCMMLTTPKGASIPPMPPLGPHAADLFAKALKTPIEIAEDDSEDVKQKKRIVQAAREDMYDELCRGKTVEEVIDDYCTTVNENNKLRAEAKAEYRRLLEEEGEDMAEQYRGKANELLEKNGIEAVAKHGERPRRGRMNQEPTEGEIQ